MSVAERSTAYRARRKAEAEAAGSCPGPLPPAGGRMRRLLHLRAAVDQLAAAELPKGFGD